MGVELSVIICTQNRADILRKCLDSFVRQTAEPSCFEVIIMNTATADHTAVVAAEFETATSKAGKKVRERSTIKPG